MTDIAATGGTAGSSLPAVGGTSTQGLAPWASGYITDYLGKAQALANTPYQVYQGPLTAGATDLQTKAFQGIGNLTVPNNGMYTPVGGTFASTQNVNPNVAAPFNPNQGLSQFDPSYLDQMRQQKAAMGNQMTPEQQRMSEIMTGFTSDQLQQQQNNFGNQPSNGGSIVVGGSDSTGGGQGASPVQQYMNPYLEDILKPQLDALRRQSQIEQNAIGAKYAGSGAFGGASQTLAQSQANANLARNLNQTVGQGYSNAFDKAQQQFNTEQQRKIQEAQFGANFGLQGLEAKRGLLGQQAALGEAQRGITSEGIAADKAEFEKQREYPFKQIQFQQSALSGLPTASVTNQPAQLSGIAQLLSSLGGIDKLLGVTGQGSLADIFTSSGLGNLFSGLFSGGGGDDTTPTPTGTGAGTGTGGIP